MRLTKIHRQAFVNAVMQDVPKVDYSQQFRDRVWEDMIESAPPKLAEVLKDKSLAHYALHPYHSATSSWTGVYCYDIAPVQTYKEYMPSEKAVKELRRICELAEKQRRERDEMQAKIAAAIEGCSTRKDALKAMPEFEKYLPAEEPPKTKNLPAVANLAADLIKMGWPKGGQKAVAA